MKRPTSRARGVCLRFFLVLGHPLKLTHPREAAQEPGQLGMGRHPRLEEQDTRARIQTASNTETGEVQTPSVKRRGLPRHGEGMEVDDGEDAVFPPLQIDPRADCAKVVSQGQDCRWAGCR